MKEIDKIALLYLKNGQILSTLSKGKDTYYLPERKRELDETDKILLYEKDVIKDGEERYHVYDKDGNFLEVLSIAYAKDND